MTAAERFQIMLVGVGGQGVLAAAQILGAAAHAEDIPVVVGQLHGMSQRGGSVQCTVLLGPGESSFLCGPADVVIAFEPSEALRASPSMGQSTRVVLSRAAIVAVDTVLANGAAPEVDEIVRQLRAECGEVRALDTRPLASAVGESRSLNVLMLGAASGLGMLPISESALLDAITERCGRKYESTNRRAFFVGRDATRGERSQRAQSEAR